MSRKTVWLLSVFFTSLILSSPTAAADVHALFDLTAPTTGPFPSDWFTVPDRSQNTRRRVSLPVPDCAERASDCADLSVINTLDGFNVQPRVSIPFDGPIDVSTVTSSRSLSFASAATMRVAPRITRTMAVATSVVA